MTKRIFAMNFTRPLRGRVGTHRRCVTGWGDLSTRALLAVERPSPHPAARDARVDPPPQGAGDNSSYAFAAAFGQYLSRRCRFTSFPVGVRGSSASKSILLGHLIGDKCLRQNRI